MTVSGVGFGTAFATVEENQGGGAGAMPSASSAGQLPVSTGPGVTYAALNRAVVVETALAEVAEGLAAGTPAEGAAVVADGAGGLKLTSAAVSEMLSKSDRDAVLTYLGIVPGVVRLSFFAYVSAAVTTVAGFGYFDPSDYTISGKTTVVALEAVGCVTSVTQTGSVQLVDCSDDTVAATLSWTETNPTRKAVLFSLPGAAKTYKVRVSCTGVADPLTDYALVGACSLRIHWS